MEINNDPFLEKMIYPSMERLNLRNRTFNTLRRERIECVDDLLKHTDKQLKELRGVSDTLIEDITENLARFGLCLSS